MKNKLVDLNNHLFEQLERLNDDELTDADLEKEIKRSKAMACISPHRNSRSNWYCGISRTEVEPHRRISQAKGDVIPTRTSPKWCPLREGARNAN